MCESEKNYCLSEIIIKRLAVYWRVHLYSAGSVSGKYEHRSISDGCIFYVLCLLAVKSRAAEREVK
ncbi:hypothetical protein US8_00047 [Bacillus altitudinis]|nr:hypothetical protein US8_00047 [Bacillus altitudinis]